MCYNIDMKYTLREVTDKVNGCLLGGALGDALGYPIEFDPLSRIKARYGANGRTDFDGDCELVSDDTQMTLFSVDAIVAYLRGESELLDLAAQAYLRWLLTQRVSPDSPEAKNSYIPRELFARRAPGTTCVTSLESGDIGTVDKPINSSKGCGGVMRAAPAGLFARVYADEKIAAEHGAILAAITHGHELGYIPAAQLACIVALSDTATLAEAVDESRAVVGEMFASARHIAELDALVANARKLAASSASDEDAIRALGEGWVGEEALAISLFCALRYEDDFKSAIVAAVNHSGDSDSTGSITGNILGARMGADALPQDLKARVEMTRLICDKGEELALEIARVGDML